MRHARCQQVEGRFESAWITKRAIRMLLAAVNESRDVSKGKAWRDIRFGCLLVAVNGSRMAPRNQRPRGFCFQNAKCRMQNETASDELILHFAFCILHS